MKVNPHFDANIEMYATEAGGPQRGYFGFPDAGFRAVPIEMAGLEGYNTICIYHQPNTKIDNGCAFTADCRVISEECFAPAVYEDQEFYIWDGRRIAKGIVTKLYKDNWSVKLPEST